MDPVLRYSLSEVPSVWSGFAPSPVSERCHRELRSLALRRGRALCSPALCFCLAFCRFAVARVSHCARVGAGSGGRFEFVPLITEKPCDPSAFGKPHLLSWSCRPGVLGFFLADSPRCVRIAHGSQRGVAVRS